MVKELNLLHFPQLTPSLPKVRKIATQFGITTKQCMFRALQVLHSHRFPRLWHLESLSCLSEPGVVCQLSVCQYFFIIYIYQQVAVFFSPRWAVAQQFTVQLVCQFFLIFFYSTFFSTFFPINFLVSALLFFCVFLLALFDPLRMLEIWKVWYMFWYMFWPSQNVENLKSLINVLIHVITNFFYPSMLL